VGLKAQRARVFGGKPSVSSDQCVPAAITNRYRGCVDFLPIFPRGLEMKARWVAVRRWRHSARVSLALLLVVSFAASAFAQANGNSPWENAVGVLQQAFTSTIARGLSLVAIVVSGLTFAFGEGGSKRVLAGVLFGVGMAIAAVNFMAWLFP
jgi:type IV secretion system protein TrbC